MWRQPHIICAVIKRADCLECATEGAILPAVARFRTNTAPFEDGQYGAILPLCQDTGRLCWRAWQQHK